MGKKTIIHKDFMHLQQFVGNLPAKFLKEGEYLHNGRNQVKRFRVNGEWIIVKKYKKPNIAQKVVYSFFKSSKAERAYHFAAKLREMNLLTPQEIAYIEIKKKLLLDESYFISTQCSYAAVSQVMENGEPQLELIPALCKFLAHLHHLGVIHGDLSMNNILYRVEEGSYEFTLIDINRTKFKESLTKEECIKNMERLSHNKELMKLIGEEYGRLRGWNPSETGAALVESLSQWENRIARKRKFQRALGLRK